MAPLKVRLYQIYLIVSGNIKGKFNIKNLYIRKDGTLSGKAKYFVVTIDSGGKVLGELGLTKAPRTNNII